MTSWADSFNLSAPPELWYYGSLDAVNMTYPLSEDTCTAILDTLSGLLNQYQATLFVVNVSQGNNISYYDSEFAFN